MTRSSVLVFSFLLVAPCASMKMKGKIAPEIEELEEDGPKKKKMDLIMPNCLRIRYNQLSAYNTKSCYVYHSFMGYHPETGQVKKSPEVNNFQDDIFILDGISDKLTWKWAKHLSSWASSFVAETADGQNHEVNCNKRKANYGVIPGYIDTCPHGPIWQAESNYNKTRDTLAAMKTLIKHDKKVLHIVAKAGFKEAKNKTNDLRDAMQEGKRVKKLAIAEKDKKKKKK